jgi:hypothetical protein
LYGYVKKKKKKKNTIKPKAFQLNISCGKPHLFRRVLSPNVKENVRILIN